MGPSSISSNSRTRIAQLESELKGFGFLKGTQDCIDASCELQVASLGIEFKVQLTYQNIFLQAFRTHKIVFVTGLHVLSNCTALLVLATVQAVNFVHEKCHTRCHTGELVGLIIRIDKVFRC